MDQGFSETKEDWPVLIRSKPLGETPMEKTKIDLINLRFVMFQSLLCDLLQKYFFDESVEVCPGMRHAAFLV